MFYNVLSPTLLFPYCSRLPGFKSSLNEVHLRIYHVLEATSYLSDVRKMHHSCMNARDLKENLPSVFSRSALVWQPGRGE
jgi:hypothetical protein